MRRVVSPYVARLYDFVETDRTAAIVMEAVPGVSLQAILAVEPVLAPESALALLKGSLLGLTAAHAAGTVHRDYKPGNVLVPADRRSVLVDFGIAVLAGQRGSAIGSPAYMAPEQWNAGIATPATDIYAATCVFFQCVAGHRPYRGSTEELRVLHERAAIPVEEVPAAVRSLVASGMAKSPTGRPADAVAFVALLEAAAAAGYGQEWEERGWRRLAAHAGALLALSPLATLLGAATVAAPTTVMAAGAAAGAAGAAASGGVLGATAIKIAAAVVGIGLATGTAVVVINTKDDPVAAPPPVTSTVASPVRTTTAAPIQISTRQRTETFDTFTFDGQYVEVSGLADAALQDRVNAALAAPVDDWVDFVTAATGDPQPGVDPATASVEARVRISGPNVVSVDYLRIAGDTGVYFGAGGEGSVHPVAVDLATGRLLTLTDVFPDAATPAGAAAIAERVRTANPNGLCGDQEQAGTTPLELAPGSFTDPYSTGGDPLVQLVLTQDTAEFVIYASAFGYATACDLTPSAVPYAELTDLMSQEAVDLLTG
ncbi:hypothetical protein GCM10027436_63370 [Actinophytocola sediminis]